MTKPIVTDEMVEAACGFLNRYYDSKCDLHEALGALEAALAVQPKPEQVKLTEDEAQIVHARKTRNVHLTNQDLIAIIDRLTGREP